MTQTNVMPELSPSAEGSLPGEHVLRRIGWLTLGIGFAGAASAAFLGHPDWAKGIVCGTVLGWLNFRWLKRGVQAMVRSVSASASARQSVSAQETAENRQDTTGSAMPTYLLMAFRYALVALGVYVIFIYLHVPLVSIGLGLCALGAATIAASVWEVLIPAK
jgi:hypothetical protein